jgi:16S rRNA (guanine527-N7)-methyltransferase
MTRTDRPLESRLPAAADALGLTLSDGQIAQLLDYLALIQRWNRVYNLTAIRDPEAMLTHHVIDSLAVVPALRQGHCTRLTRVLDVGSGAGLPGVVIAITLPGLAVDCVDTVGKKASFIQQVAAELRLPHLRGLHARVEALPPAAADVVTSRAFSSLLDFTQLTRQHLAPGGVWMAMKGKHPTDELATLPSDIDVFHVEHLTVPGLDAERCVVWMKPRNA